LVLHTGACGLGETLIASCRQALMKKDRQDNVSGIHQGCVIA
jgi:hypothetical protein